ncbi:unnamed protein product, partial [marine sediment metagenome]
KITNPGSRIVSAEVYRNGSWVPLDSSATYTVLVNGWTASGGDGHYIFLKEDISKENTTTVTTDILASYIQRHGTISPQVEGRINFGESPVISSSDKAVQSERESLICLQ